MPLVFIGMMQLGPGASAARIASSLAVSVTAAGAAVGAVHGLFLVRMLRR